MEDLNNKSTEKLESSLMEKLKNYIKNYWSTSINPSFSASYTCSSSNSANSANSVTPNNSSNKLNSINTINTITNVSGFSTATSGYCDVTGTSYSDEYTWDVLGGKFALDTETMEKIIEKTLDRDEDLYPIVEKYLINHLEKIMDNPDKIVQKLLENKDTKIKELEEEVENLKQLVKQQGTIIEEIHNRLIFDERKLPDDYGGYYDGNKIWYGGYKYDPNNVTCTYKSYDSGNYWKNIN